MSKQQKGLKRNTIDKFYTKSTVVSTCIQLIKSKLSIDPINDLIIEPSAGNGSFIPFIKNLTNNYKFYDLLPEHKEIEKQDYLTLNYNSYTNKRIHIIGNPPFGRQASLALKFIKYSTQFCNSISFILPKSFKKDSMKNKLDLHFHLICEHNLPKNSFIVNNKEHEVPCVFQIWIRKKVLRILKPKLIPFHYKFVKKVETHDIAVRRVGVYAGSIFTETENKSHQSHYFIKFDNELTYFLLWKLQNIKFLESDYTVGPKSISKQELIKEYNKYM